MIDFDETAWAVADDELAEQPRHESGREQDWPDFVRERHLDRADQELIGTYRSWLVSQAAISAAARRTKTGGLNGGATDGR